MFNYCEEDVKKSSELFRRQVMDYRDYAPVDVELVLAWSEYSAKAVPRIQARGMPIDMPLWNLVQENKAAVVRALILRFDPSYIDGAQSASTPLTANGATSGSRSGWRMSASRLGRGWTPVSCKSTATPSA